MTNTGPKGLPEGASADVSWPPNSTVITVPAHPDFVASIRSVARSAAVLADLSLDDVEELQIGVDEAAALLLPLVDTEGTWLRARFEIDPGGVVITLDLVARDGARLDRSGLAWMMLTAIDPDVAVTEDGAFVAITIVRRRTTT
ncbi:hypothetical protein FE697_017685 [Mumia zhuanghuii]|uniref:Serine/threonine-protein kinase RsbW n=2 Tax=Mumia TaxID=1546255 RepID=A0ABW1QND3_9ACTN|nr:MULTISPECIES: hypothetical protein [Mumia]KAA1419744.1 hypothetical protein FE697_017685 [Mumia zhuanghuii]